MFGFINKNLKKFWRTNYSFVGFIYIRQQFKSYFLRQNYRGSYI